MEQINKKSYSNKFQQNGLNIPKGYFDTLDQRIVEKITTEQNGETTPPRPQQTLNIKKIKVKKLWWGPIAAAIALIMTVKALNTSQADSPEPVTQRSMEQSQNILLDYLVLHVSESELIAAFDQEDFQELFLDANEWERYENQALINDAYFNEFQLIN